MYSQILVRFIGYALETFKSYFSKYLFNREILAMLKKIFVFSLIIFWAFMSNAQAESVEKMAKKFMDDFYGAFQTARINDAEKNVAWVKGFFTEDSKMFTHPFFQYDETLSEADYYTEPINNNLAGVSVGQEEIANEVIVPFLTYHPGMIHDVKTRIVSHQQKHGIVKIWLFYDFKAAIGVEYTGENTQINFPGVSIYTVDLYAARRNEDGEVTGYGKVIDGRIIFDNLKYMTQVGMLICKPPVK